MRKNCHVISGHSVGGLLPNIQLSMAASGVNAARFLPICRCQATGGRHWATTHTAGMSVMLLSATRSGSLQAIIPGIQQLVRCFGTSGVAGGLSEAPAGCYSRHCLDQKCLISTDNTYGEQEPPPFASQHDLRQQLSMWRQLQDQQQQVQQQWQRFGPQWPAACVASSRASNSSSCSRCYCTANQRHSLRQKTQPLVAAAVGGLRDRQPLPQQQQQQQQLPYQWQQQRGVKQLAPIALAPKPLPRFRKPNKDGRMNRMVIRIPPQVTVELQDNALTLTGKAGSTSLKLPFLDPTGLVAWQAHIQSGADAAAGPGTGSLLLLASPSKRCWRGIQTHINNAVHGVVQGYLVGLTVQGVGYRMEPVPEKTIAAALAARRGLSPEEAATAGSSKRRIIWEQEAEKTNIAYPHKEPAKAVRLKVGYTRACIFQLPEGVLAFFVKPTLMYLYGIDKALVTNTAAAIRAVRKPNAYTGNGIQLVGEVLKLKQRAGSK